ncbi:MAG TPA: UDP-2,4-diacetamido-2,4,6-trideoxy-beta-L-altropyranose hydrolase [Bradyrhizobium sp.]|nr:UDP-2,4-diacetamido-2,4,6-trideoxy-beta-L-altropyranose hydrolase [Bradyrhizobium sp.]
MTGPAFRNFLVWISGLILGCSMSVIRQVVIRVDASVEMGMGHLARCMSLANELSRGGARIVFVMREHAARLGGLVEANGHTPLFLRDPERHLNHSNATDRAHSHWLPTTWQGDAEQSSEVIGGIGHVDWLIVDHYALDAEWESVQRRYGVRILAIDDLADRPHDCDILLDQNLVLNMEARYRNRVSATCKQMLGPRYALLRPEFAEARKSTPDRSGDIHRILVCFGGSDPSNETAKALAAIKGVDIDSLAIDVVVGSGNPHADLISRLSSELPCAELHRGADNMAALMSRADLAIGAGGIMSWERCCLGLPTIAVDIAANQIGTLTALARAGAVVYLGSASSVTPRQIASAIQLALNDSENIKAMGEAARLLVDGEGCGRVRAAMEI